ncbi:choice-of-anchor L domain-containing protein [Thiothrix winogradskyi]|uniref:DUF11 domain-containing protein n=1 Tax=Thiothrix winogradskyi TaxID=96472 RepID=A0ABY3T4X7_9GAMM|nr:choice-of-anchor L domain-containing protein [Thiothrix winogradskyi]UJS25796.1 DUF11 domain-containing protein [Thiothrix winogradskyi]
MAIIKTSWSRLWYGLALLCIPLTDTYAAGLTLNQSASIAAMTQALDGPGLAISNVTITKGAKGQYGTFTGGTDVVGAGPVIGIPGGLFISTGTTAALVGKNTNGSISIGTGVSYADPDLTLLSSQAIFDPVIIEFDIVPVGDKVNFVLVFGSEEYPEFVCSQFNDAFGLFVSGLGLDGTKNAAFLPNTNQGITVNNINAGVAGAFQDGSACNLSNAMFFNDNGNGSGNANTQLDGFSKPTTAGIKGLTAGETYHIKLALADAADAAFDSGVFFKWLTSTVSRPVDMELTATASTLTPKQYDTLTLTYTLHNRSGAVDGELLQTQLQWPAGMSIISHDGGSAYNPTTAVWEAGTVSANSSKSITFTVQMNTEGSHTPMAEILYALHDDFDSTPFNSATFPDEDDTARLNITTSSVPTLALQVRGLLQGAYNSTDGLMRDDLRRQGFLPLAQPYVANSLLGYAGAEVTTAERLALTGNDAPVDWVVVELRDKTTPKTVLARTTGLLQRDGDVVNPLTNDTTLRVPLPQDAYYVSLRHRNHLGVMTQAAMPLSATTALVDFTLPTTAVSGQYARASSQSKALLWAGDTNFSNNAVGIGPGNDANPLLGTIMQHPSNASASSNFRLPGYYAADLNMDGLSVYSGPGNDTNLLLGNIAQYPANGAGAANYIISGTIPK